MQVIVHWSPTWAAGQQHAGTCCTVLVASTAGSLVVHQRSSWRWHMHSLQDEVRLTVNHRNACWQSRHGWPIAVCRALETELLQTTTPTQLFTGQTHYIPSNSIWPHLSYSLVRSKREYCHNCSLVVVLCCTVIWAAHRFWLPDLASSHWVHSLCLGYFVCVSLLSFILSACMLYVVLL